MTLQDVADRVARGAALHEDDAPVIIGTDDLIAVGMLADDVRRQMHGAATTFVRVLEVHVGAVPATRPPNLSAGEVRIVGRPESEDAAHAAVEAARRLAGATPLTGFSLADLAALDAGSPGAFGRLAGAGLDGVAEAPIDQLATPAATIDRARTGGLLVQRMTVQAAPGDPVALLTRARDVLRTPGGFVAFAPLPRTISLTAPTTGYDDVKLIALARLLVREAPSIQVDWPLYGPKLAQVALTVGADDVDGVGAVESGALGPRRTAIEEIRGNIRAAGLQPLERNGRYALLE